MMYMQPVKTTLKEFTYEHSSHMQPVNKDLELYVLFFYDFNSMQIVPIRSSSVMTWIVSDYVGCA